MTNLTRDQLVEICDHVGYEEFRSTYGKLYSRTRIGATITTVKALRLKRFAESLVASGKAHADCVTALIYEGNTSPANAERLLASASKRTKVTA